MIRRDRLGEWVFGISLILLAIYFLVRIIDMSKITYIFPLIGSIDWNSHMAQLFLLKTYGYNNLVPVWYGGIYIFSLYPPGWYFFTLPLYLLIKNVQISAYLSMLVLLAVNFISIFYIGKLQGLSIWKRILFFLILFANPISIGNFIVLGRVSELFAWTLVFLLILLLMVYETKKIDFKFILLYIVLFSFLLLSHPATTFLYLIYLFSYLLLQNRIKWVNIFFLTIIGIALTSFWWPKYIISLSGTIVTTNISERLLNFSGPWMWTSIASIIIPLSLWVVFIFYYKSSKRNKKELIFFLPALLFSFLLLSKAIIFIPIFNRVFPDIYIFYFLFFLSLYFLKTNFSYFGFLKKVVYIIFVLVVILSIFVSVYHTPFFKDHNSFQSEILEILPEINAPYYILPIDGSVAYISSFINYATIFLDKTTVGGSISLFRTKEYGENVDNLIDSVSSNDCVGISEALEELNASNLIGSEDQCNVLEECEQLKEIKKTDNVCLYSSK